MQQHSEMMGSQPKNGNNVDNKKIFFIFIFKVIVQQNIYLFSIKQCIDIE